MSGVCESISWYCHSRCHTVQGSVKFLTSLYTPPSRTADRGCPRNIFATVPGNHMTYVPNVHRNSAIKHSAHNAQHNPLDRWLASDPSDSHQRASLHICLGRGVDGYVLGPMRIGAPGVATRVGVAVAIGGLLRTSRKTVLPVPLAARLLGEHARHPCRPRRAAGKVI